MRAETLSSAQEYFGLLKSLQGDSEWKRIVMNEKYLMVTSSGRGAPLTAPSGVSQWPVKEPVSDDEPVQKKYPCSHCGASITDYNRHIMSSCVAFEERFAWRKNNILNYIDSILDHNKYKVYCNLPDRKTSSGGTIPHELLSIVEGSEGCFRKSLVPDLTVTDRLTNHIRIFVISIADEIVIPEVQTAIFEKYYDFMEEVQASNQNVNFYTIEIGAFTGKISEGTKFSLWEIYKLANNVEPVNVFLENITNLARIGSFVIFKTRKDRRWKRKSHFLNPVRQQVIQKGLLRSYIIPIGKRCSLILLILTLILVLHLCYQFSGWLWTQMTIKVVVFIYAVAMILFLLIFRP